MGLLDVCAGGAAGVASGDDTSNEAHMVSSFLVALDLYWTQGASFPCGIGAYQSITEAAKANESKHGGKLAIGG